MRTRRQIQLALLFAGALPLGHCLSEAVEETYYEGTKFIAGGQKPLPVELTVTENAPNDFTVTWTPSIDPDDNKQVPEYFLYMLGNERTSSEFNLSEDFVWQCTIGSFFVYNEEACQTETCIQIEDGNCSTVRDERRLALVFHNYQPFTFSLGLTGYDGQRESLLSNIEVINTVASEDSEDDDTDDTTGTEANQ